MPTIRVWDEIHHVYKQAADEHGIVLSQLVSSILLALPVECAGCLAYVIQEAFEMKPDKAKEIAYEIRHMILDMIKVAEAGSREEEVEALCEEEEAPC